MDQIPYVETLPDDVRRRYRTYAIIASCFGCFGELLQDSSAIILLYFLALGAGESLTMFQTAFPGIASLVLLIPVSGFIAKYGPKKMIRLSCLIALTSYLFMATSPYFGTFGKYWCALWCLVFCSARIIWSGSWFPLLQYILLPRERAPFFGLLRFTYHIFIGVIFFAVGSFMDKNTPIWFLQIVIVGAGLLAWGRWLFMKKIVIPDQPEATVYDLKKALGISLRNAPLVMFSVYVCFLMAACAAISPFTILYLKKGLGCGDNMVQILSTITIAGNVTGFFCYSRIDRAIGTKWLQLGGHFSFILLLLGLACCGKDVPHAVGIVSVLLFLCNFVWAIIYASISSEMLALSRPGNTTMASAFCQTYQQLGMATGRTISSLLIGGNILAAFWDFHGMTVSSYQSIFLIFAAIAIFSLALIFCIPSVIPRHDAEYYNP